MSHRCLCLSACGLLEPVYKDVTSKAIIHPRSFLFSKKEQSSFYSYHHSRLQKDISIMKFSISSTILGSLLGTGIHAVSFDLFNGQDCAGLETLSDFQPPDTDVGCTGLPLNEEQAFSVTFISTVAENCLLTFYSDVACGAAQAIINTAESEYYD